MVEYGAVRELFEYKFISVKFGLELYPAFNDYVHAIWIHALSAEKPILFEIFYVHCVDQVELFVYF